MAISYFISHFLVFFIFIKIKHLRVVINKIEILSQKKYFSIFLT